MEFRDKQAIYIQIAEYVCDGILNGKWVPGERIPSVRDLALTLEVNPHTILRSYEYLQNEGIIFSKRGLGYSASTRAKELIISYRKERFLEKELPRFFASIHQLNISMEEIGRRYGFFVDQIHPVNP
ncbi:GntR family transcriptional regulator [Salmonirosea aquatica]|uniref:GntR family transcriptional regulator n=1 Tax=Salmonirosea aquatica TaxID=2654236 RepID=A0A7C9F6R5_9BACT|nr:GntR family transcriptional regulator [Cytophagaceae bacterium SJW1-29]